MFSIDMYKSYKPKIKNKHFEVLRNKVFSWKSKFEWLYYYIDKSSLVFSKDKKNCEFKIEFFKKEQLISEIHFEINSDRQFWSSLTDKQLNFIRKVVNHICFFWEKLWIYVIPELIISSYWDYGYYLRDNRFKNFKVFDEDFNLLYEIRDKTMLVDSDGNVETFKGNNKWVEALITKEWFFVEGEKNWKLMENWTMIFEDKNSNDESSEKEDKKVINYSYSKHFSKEISKVEEKIIRIISKKSYIKTQWNKWLKKIYLELTRIKLEDFENELIYFTNNDLKYRKSFLFSLTEELLEKKTFVVKHSYHNMLIQDNWKFNYIF